MRNKKNERAVKIAMAILIYTLIATGAYIFLGITSVNQSVKIHEQRKIIETQQEELRMWQLCDLDEVDCN